MSESITQLVSMNKDPSHPGGRALYFFFPDRCRLKCSIVGGWRGERRDYIPRGSCGLPSSTRHLPSAPSSLAPFDSPPICFFFFLFRGAIQTISPTSTTAEEPVAYVVRSQLELKLRVSRFNIIKDYCKIKALKVSQLMNRIEVNVE